MHLDVRCWVLDVRCWTFDLCCRTSNIDGTWNIEPSPSVAPREPARYSEGCRPGRAFALSFPWPRRSRSRSTRFRRHHGFAQLADVGRHAAGGGRIRCQSHAARDRRRRRAVRGRRAGLLPRAAARVPFPGRHGLHAAGGDQYRRQRDDQAGPVCFAGQRSFRRDDDLGDRQPRPAAGAARAAGCPTHARTTYCPRGGRSTAEARRRRASHQRHAVGRDRPADRCPTGAGGV